MGRAVVVESDVGLAVCPFLSAAAVYVIARKLTDHGLFFCRSKERKGNGDWHWCNQLRSSRESGWLVVVEYSVGLP